MKTISKLLLFCMILLTACVKQTQPDPAKAAEQVCVKACQSQYQQCQALCHHNCTNCGMESARSTAQSFGKYAHEQAIKGEIIKRDTNAFHDPLRCRKTSCACAGDYVICQQACSGIIKKRLQAAPVCC